MSGHIRPSTAYSPLPRWRGPRVVPLAVATVRPIRPRVVSLDARHLRQTILEAAAFALTLSWIAIGVRWAMGAGR